MKYILALLIVGAYAMKTVTFENVLWMDSATQLRLSSAMTDNDGYGEEVRRPA